MKSVGASCVDNFLKMCISGSLSPPHPQSPSFFLSNEERRQRFVIYDNLQAPYGVQLLLGFVTLNTH